MTGRALIIAEAGVNHNGSLDLARKLVDAASAAGADVVKFQTFRAEALASRLAAQAAYQARNTGILESQVAMLERLTLSRDAHLPLAAHCKAQEIEFLSTPFDQDGLDFLVAEVGVRRIKLGSGEVTNAPLLLAAARSGLPVIVSTGMATLGEVESALGVLAFGYSARSDQPCRAAFAMALNDIRSWEILRARVTLLHCTTDYPAAPADANLAAMDTLAGAFRLSVGYSDHTTGTAIATAAVARGAVAIEKHFTLDRTLPGPDHKASLEPAELADLVEAIRTVEAALGDGRKQPRPAEMKNVAVVRRSLVAARAIAAGELFTTHNLTTKRPGSGRSPFDYWELLGNPAPRAYEADEVIGHEDRLLR